MASSTAATDSRTLPFGAYLRAIRRDIPLHGFVLSYLSIGLALTAVAGVPGKFLPLTYSAMSLPIFIIGFIVAGGVWALWSREPFVAIAGAARKATTPDGVASLLLISMLLLHMGVFTSIKTTLTDFQPFFADPALADIDELLHGAAPWVYTTSLLPTSINRAAILIYYGVWGILLSSCLLACVFLRCLSHVRSQYLWTHLIMWPVLGNAVAVVGMSAGPMFYAEVTGDVVRFASLVTYLNGSMPPEAIDGVRALWAAHVNAQPIAAAGISAFPSLHLANATLFVLLASQISRFVAVLAIAFCAIILVLSVHLGWHYAVDGYFSILATALIWEVVGWAQRKTDPQR